MAEGFKVASAYVQLGADDAGLFDQIRAKLDAASAGAKANVGLTVNAAQFRAAVAAATSSADAGSGVPVSLNVDPADLRTKVHAAIDAAGIQNNIPIKLNLDAADAAAKLAALDAALKATQDAGNGFTQDINGRWHNALGQYASDADKAAAGLDDLGSKSDDAKTKTKGAGDAAGDAGNKAANAGNGFLGMSGKVWALVGAIGGLGPALAALPALLSGAGGAAATLGLAFSGVAGALKDHVAVTQAVGQSGASLAQTSFSNAMAIKSAEQAIVDAKRQSAQAAQSSADSIASAQQSLADAYRQAGISAASSAQSIANAQQSADNAVRQAAISQQNSLDSIAAAEERLGNAQLSQANAQKALTLATADATNQLIDLNNAAADANLSAAQAAINLTKAQQNLAAVNGSSLSTDLAKQEAALQLAQAQQGVKDANQKSLEATQAADRANKEGADGLPSVVSAQQAYTASIQATNDAKYALTVAERNAADQAVASAQAVANAQQSLANAQTAAANQQNASNESIAKAQQALVVAQRSADQQRAASAEAVAKAIQALSDTQKQQALAAAAAAASAGTALNKFAADMAKLTPAGRDFVNQVLGMKTSLHDLSVTAQNATLPGFTTMLRDLTPAIPIFNTAVGNMGGVLGGLAMQFGSLFQDPMFRGAFAGFLQQGITLTGQLGAGLVQMFKGLVVAAGYAVPIVNALGLGFQQLMGSGIPAFFKGLSFDATGAGQTISGFLGIVSDLLGPVGQLVGAFSGALGPAMIALRPVVDQLANGILSGLLPVMPSLSGALVAVVGVLQQLVPILVPAIQLFGHDLTDALTAVTPWLGSLSSFLKDNAGWLKYVADGVLGLIVAVKAWNVVTGIATTLTGQWKSAVKLFGSEGTIATGATKAWGIATSDLTKTLAIGIPILGGVLTGVGMLANKLGEMSGVGDHTALNVTKLNTAMLGFTSASPQTQDALTRTGETLMWVSQTMNKNIQGMQDYDKSLADLVTSGHGADAAAIEKKLATAVDDHGKAMNLNTAKYLPQYQAALDQQANSAKASATATDGAATSATNAQQPFSGLALRLDNVTQSGKNTTGQMSALDTSLHGIDAELAKTQALDAYTKALNGLKDGAAGSSKEISGNSQSAMDNRAQLENAVEAARHFYDAQIAAGVGVDQANATFQAQVQQLETQAEKTYGSKAAVDSFMTSLNLVPASKSVKVTVDDTDGIKTTKTIQTSIDSLHGTKVNIILDKVYGPNNEIITISGTTVKANAKGGPVQAGDVSIVGEEGPELVEFGAAGMVIPAKQTQQMLSASGAAAGPSVVNHNTINMNYYGPQTPTPEMHSIMMRDLNLAVTR